MAVNVQKNKYIVFRTRGKPIDANSFSLVYNANKPNQPYDNDLVYTLEHYYDNHPDKNCRAYKLLGVFLDEYLSFNHHTNFMCNKLSKSLYCINRAKKI